MVNSRTLIIENIYILNNISYFPGYVAAMLDSGGLIAKLTPEMDSPPSTAHGKWYYTTVANMYQKLNIDRNQAGWRPF